MVFRPLERRSREMFRIMHRHAFHGNLDPLIAAFLHGPEAAPHRYIAAKHFSNSKCYAWMAVAVGFRVLDKVIFSMLADVFLVNLRELQVEIIAANYAAILDQCQ